MRRVKIPRSQPRIPTGPTGIPYVQEPSTAPHYIDPSVWNDPFTNWWERSVHNYPREEVEDFIRWVFGVINKYGQGLSPQEINLTDTLDVTVTRKDTEETDDPDKPGGDTPDTPIDDTVTTPITPLFPPTETEESTVGEALRAKDEVEIQLGTQTKAAAAINQSPVIIGSGHGFISLKVSGKKRYLDKQSGQVLDPCQSLDNGPGGYSINRRRHVKTGRSADRLRQIRRQYAYINCR